MEAYIKSILQNIRKVYYLQNNTQIYNEVDNIIRKLVTLSLNKEINRQEIVNELFPVLSKLPTIKQREGRIEERISNIVGMLDENNFRPKSVLDIGAGTSEILTALKNYYGLTLNDVYAIDPKLPKFTDVTPLEYKNGYEIPLPNKSMDLIIIFVTLHHIPPDIREKLIGEVSRVLSKDGYVIIREHDDNKDPLFTVYLDIIHLFWYIAKDEVVDPLYLLSRGETIELFQNFNMLSVKYQTYYENNPQKLYYEMFKKEDIIYKFYDLEAKSFFQSFIDIFRNASPSTDSFDKLVPDILKKKLSQNYQLLLYQSNEYWKEFIKELSLIIILESANISPKTHGVVSITKDTINNTIKLLQFSFY